MMNIVMQLRKCCNHPYLFPGVEDRTLVCILLILLFTALLLVLIIVCMHAE
jgi:SNF2 family DNA or RNA helicase